jgi:hypothetical protein
MNTSGNPTTPKPQTTTAARSGGKAAALDKTPRTPSGGSTNAEISATSKTAKGVPLQKTSPIEHSPQVLLRFSLVKVQIHLLVMLSQARLYLILLNLFVVKVHMHLLVMLSQARLFLIQLNLLVNKVQIH